MSALQDLLSQYRDLSQEKRGKGTLFEFYCFYQKTKRITASY